MRAGCAARCFELAVRQEMASGRHVPDVGLLLIARRYGLTRDCEDAAWVRFHGHRLASFGDSVVAELLLRGADLSQIPADLALATKPYRAVCPVELARMFDTVAHRNLVRLGKIFHGDRKTMRTRLRLAQTKMRSALS